MDYFLLRRAFRQALAEQPISVKMVPFGHLVIIPKWNNDVRGPPTGLYWRILYGYTWHVVGTETQTFVCPKEDPTTAYAQIANFLAVDASVHQNFFAIATTSTSLNKPLMTQELILDDTMLVRHIGDPTGFARMSVWEWEASKVYRL